MARKIQKLPFDLPRSIILLNGNTYYNSNNGDRINVNQLEKYVTGKDPAASENIPKEITAAKDELIRAKRWDLEK